MKNLLSDIDMNGKRERPASINKKSQDKKLQSVGFQGEHGAYSEAAAKAYNPRLAPIPCTGFIDVFAGIENNTFDLGILPVENSLEGAVTEVNDLLINYDKPFQIVGEIRLSIAHSLLTLKETEFEEIKFVYSHPQAIAQCRGFISRNKLEPHQYYDTAGAAKMLSLFRPGAAAVIANTNCAGIYDLKVVREGIQDEEVNFTRFLIISKEDNKNAGNKCSITFSTRHHAGALHEILGYFAAAGINLTRIESRPIKKDPGKYAFLLDFTCSIEDAILHNILDRVKEKCVTYKFLGAYMAG